MGKRPTRSRRRGSGYGPEVHAPQLDAETQERVQASLSTVDTHLAGLMAGAGAHASEDLDFDFDAHWAAKKGAARPRRVKIKGRLYILPGSMPAGVMFFGMRSEFSKKSKEISDVRALELTKEMLEMALGAAAVDQMIRDGIGMEELPDVLTYVMGNFDELGRLRDASLEAAGGAGEVDPGEAGAGPTPGTSGS
jgi:hypothetical protein